MLPTILALIAGLAGPVTQQIELLMPPKKGLSAEEQKAYNEQRAQAGVNLAMTGLSVAGILTGNPALGSIIRAVNDFSLAQQKTAAGQAPPAPSPAA